MKKLIILSAALLSIGIGTAHAQLQAKPPLQAINAVKAQPDPVAEKLTTIEQEWARIKYKVAGKDEQIEALNRLEGEAAALVQAYPASAGPKIWQAIILSTDAGFAGGLSALPKVKAAKQLLEASLKIDPKALEGSASTSLGSLYYQVPGWPIGFGDEKKAELYLTAALKINPDGIDPNFFYGDYLSQNKKYDEAIPVLEKGLKAAARPGREVADEGRRAEINALLEKAREKAGKESKTKYN